ncbi:hypothetical protein GCM10027449_11410 [Sinomonas notoginsengisoli]
MLPGRDLNKDVLGGQTRPSGAAKSLCDGSLPGTCIAREHHDSRRALGCPVSDEPAKLGLHVVAKRVGELGEMLPVGSSLVRAED